MKKFLITMLILLLLGGSAVGISYSIKNKDVSVDTSGSLQEETTTTNNDVSLSKIAELTEQVNAYAKEVSTLKSYVAELEQSEEDNQVIIDGLEEVITNKTNELEAVRLELQELQEAYDKLQADYEELQNQFSSSDMDTDTLIGLYDGSVTEIVVPEGVTTIRPYAFYGLSLNKLEIPSTVSVIGQSAFGNLTCQNLSIQGSESLNVGNSAFQSAKIENLEIIVPGSLNAGGYAFNGIQGINLNIEVSGTLTLTSSHSFNIYNTTVNCDTLYFDNNISSFYPNANLSDAVMSIQCNTLQFDKMPSFDSRTTIKVMSKMYTSSSYSDVPWYAKCPIYYYGDNEQLFNKSVSLMSDFILYNMSEKTVQIDYAFNKSGSSSSSIYLYGDFRYNISSIFTTSSGSYNCVDFSYDDTNSVVITSTSTNRIKKVINRSTNYSNNFIHMLSSVTEEIYVADALYDQYVADANYSAYASLFHKISELDATGE